MTSPTEPITIRRATEDDARALDRLSGLDSQRLPAGPHLVALAGDRYVAAVSLCDGRWVADPFVRSDGVVDLLRERAGTLTGRPLPPRGIPIRRFGAKLGRWQTTRDMRGLDAIDAPVRARSAFDGT